MAQKIVCDSSSISVLLKNFEDMQARDNSNNRLENPMNALVVTSGQNQIKFNNPSPNKRSREHKTMLIELIYRTCQTTSL